MHNSVGLKVYENELTEQIPSIMCLKKKEKNG